MRGPGETPLGTGEVAVFWIPIFESSLGAKPGAAYCKISKFQLALDDVELAMEIEPKWSEALEQQACGLC